MINAIDILRRDALPRVSGIRVQIIGAPHYERDREYLDELKQLVKEKDLDKTVEFTGAIPNKDIVAYYHAADLSVNLCPTGGLDKAVLESLASGTPVIALNRTFKEILPENLMLESDDPQKLADKIKAYIELPDTEKQTLTADLRESIKLNFSLENLIAKIVKIIKS